MPLDTIPEHKRSSLSRLNSKGEDTAAFPEFLRQRALDYKRNSEDLLEQSERQASLGHITESQQLLKESREVEKEANEYVEKLFNHNLEISRELRRHAHIDAEKSALALQESIKRMAGEPKNNCTPIKIIREITNEMFLLLTDEHIFDTSGNLEHLKTEKGIIGALLVGFDALQTKTDKQNKLQECQTSINEELKPFIDTLEDDLHDYFKENRPQTHSISRSKSVYNRAATSTKSFLKTVTGNVFSKSGKTKTNTTYLDIIKNIISKLGYNSYFPNNWVDATTSEEVKENFMTFCNELMKDIKNIYVIVKSHTKCSEDLHFGALHIGESQSGKRQKSFSARYQRASIGGKSRKKNKPKRTTRKPKRKSRKNKNK
jgi:hypothetical protein